MYAASPWHDLPEKPPLHLGVLVELKRLGIAGICDVACYAGQFQVEGGGTEDRWILADVRLDSRQIKRWAYIYVPDAIKDDPATLI